MKESIGYTVTKLNSSWNKRKLDV